MVFDVEMHAPFIETFVSVSRTRFVKLDGDIYIYYPYAWLSKKKNNLEENILNGSVKMSDTFNLYYTMLYLCPVNQHQHLYQSTFLTHGLL